MKKLILLVALFMLASPVLASSYGNLYINVRCQHNLFSNQFVMLTHGGNWSDMATYQINPDGKYDGLFNVGTYDIVLLDGNAGHPEYATVTIRPDETSYVLWIGHAVSFEPGNLMPLPTTMPTWEPTSTPTVPPTEIPTTIPTSVPTTVPTSTPTTIPTTIPTTTPTVIPTTVPTTIPTTSPTISPTPSPTLTPHPTPTPKLCCYKYECEEWRHEGLWCDCELKFHNYGQCKEHGEDWRTMGCF